MIHRKVNLPDSYSFMPNLFEGFKITRLTISNKYCSVYWPGEIDIEGIDFSSALELTENEADIIEERLDQRKMIITMLSLPKIVQKYSPD